MQKCKFGNSDLEVSAIGVGCVGLSFGYGSAAVPRQGCDRIQVRLEHRSRNGKNNIFHNDVLLSIAGKYGKSVAQVIVCWLTQRDVVAIPKSVRKERMSENFNVFDFELSADDMDAVAMLDSKQSAFFDHRDPAIVKALGTRKIHD